MSQTEDFRRRKDPEQQNVSTYGREAFAVDKTASGGFVVKQHDVKAIPSSKFKSVQNLTSVGRLSVGPMMAARSNGLLTERKVFTDFTKVPKSGTEEPRSIFKNFSTTSKFYSSKAILMKSKPAAVAIDPDQGSQDDTFHQLPNMQYTQRPTGQAYVACSYRLGIPSAARKNALNLEHIVRQQPADRYGPHRQPVRPSPISTEPSSSFTGVGSGDTMSQSMALPSATQRRSSIHVDADDGKSPDHRNLDRSRLQVVVATNPHHPKTRSVTEPKSPTKEGSVLPNYYLAHLKKLYNYFVKLQPREDLSANYNQAVLEHFKDSIQILRFLSSDSLMNQDDHVSKRMARKQSTDKNTNLLLPKQAKPLLVLDLDETLIHKPVQGRVYREEESEELTKCLIEGRGHLEPKYLTVYKRPYLQEFLQQLAELYTIYVFTAADAAYASSIVSEIDPNRDYISRVLDRRFCSLTKEGYVVKDLRIFTKEADLHKILLVDNSSHCFFTQLKNGVPILPFYGQKDDRELLHLKRYLQALCRCDNMVERNTAHFQLEKYLWSYSTTDVLDYLFAASELVRSCHSGIRPFPRSDAVAIITNSRSTSKTRKTLMRPA